jgi:rSAM/selenodomain-associated transferase 1
VPALVCLFAKAPVAGSVKTRLAASLGPDGAALLHESFVADLLAALAPLYPLELWTDIHTDARAHFQVACKLQPQGSLGDRMLAAILSGLERGFERIVVIGADSPTVPPSHIGQLLALDADAAFGPADDGGFWALACRRASPAMFDAVPWSSPETLSAALSACARAGLSTALGPSWYDIDDESSLSRLRRDPGLSSLPATRRALARLFGA